MWSCIRLAMLASVVWFVASCAHTPAQVAYRSARFREGPVANVVLHFFRWDTIYLNRPDSRQNGFLPSFDRNGIARELERRNVGRDLAVVVIGRKYADDEQAGLIRDWQSLLATQGFRRVVVLRAGAWNQDHQIDGLPILHDSAIAGGK